MTPPGDAGLLRGERTERGDRKRESDRIIHHSHANAGGGFGGGCGIETIQWSSHVVRVLPDDLPAWMPRERNKWRGYIPMGGHKLIILHPRNISHCGKFVNPRRIGIDG